jgi:hypothetical protein
MRRSLFKRGIDTGQGFCQHRAIGRDIRIEQMEDSRRRNVVTSQTAVGEYAEGRHMSAHIGAAQAAELAPAAGNIGINDDAITDSEAPSLLPDFPHPGHILVSQNRPRLRGMSRRIGEDVKVRSADARALYLEQDVVRTLESRFFNVAQNPPSGFQKYYSLHVGSIC